MNLEELEFDSLDNKPYNLESSLDTKVKKDRGVWDKAFNKKRLKKTGKVAVLFLTNHNSAIPMELEPKNGFFTIRGKSYHEREDCTYSISKDRIPLIIIQEWSLIPLGTKEWEDKPLRSKFLELQTHVMRGIRHAELVRLSGEKEGQKINIKMLILLGIGAIIAFSVWQGGFIG